MKTNEDFFRSKPNPRSALRSFRSRSQGASDAEEKGTPNIVHFKINFKPWHYDDISFGKHFWQYAEKTPFFADLHMIRAAYTDAEREKDAGQYDGLVALANAETEKVNEHYVVPTVFSVAVMTVKECL